MDRMRLLEAFREIPTGNIADAMAALDLPCGAMVKAPRAISLTQPRMVGYARTVVQMPRHSLAQGKVLVQHPDMINRLAQPGDVVIIDVGARDDVCTAGGLLALRAKVRGLAGFVINGCFRDIAETVKNGFPVFCTGTSPTKSSPLLETAALDVPVSIGGIQVSPGELVIGDDTGIVVVPSEWAEKVLTAAYRIHQVEERMEHYVLEGLDYVECRRYAESEVSKI